MIRLTIHQVAEREAHRETDSISDPKRLREPLRAAYSRAVMRLAQEVESGLRPAWASAYAGDSPVSTDHPLWQELLDWLKNGRRSTRHAGQSGNVLDRRALIQAFVEIHNEGWIKGLFIADGPPVPYSQPGRSGTAFDHIDPFTFDQAARALVFDRTGRYVPALASRLSADGNAYHDWLDTLNRAWRNDVPGALKVTTYEDDPKKALYIQRAHFRLWCEARNMRPAFLFGGSDENRGSIATKVNVGDTQKEIPDQWKRGLKLVAYSCARTIVQEGKNLSGPALWDAVAADSRVKIRDTRTAEYSNSDASMTGGEVSATADTIKKDWRKQLETLFLADSG